MAKAPRPRDQDDKGRFRDSRSPRDRAHGHETRAQRAKRLLDRGREWESPAKANSVDDLRFAYGDSNNDYQWPQGIRAKRKDKPCLTLNVTRQHNLQIINAAKVSRSSMQVLATGSGATKASADAMNLLVHRIESLSNAQLVYDMAREFQVHGGVGYWRILSDYLPGDTFDQELFIRAIEDPTMITMDPAGIEKHGGDCNWAFVEDRMPREVFEAQYPDKVDLLLHENAAMVLSPGWEMWDDDEVQVLEQYERVPKPYDIISFIDPAAGTRKTLREDLFPPEALKSVLAEPTTRSRRVVDWEVQWTLWVGDQIADETIWPGRHIPIIRVVGEQTVIDGVLDRRGHTRALKDPQRMFNYNASAQVEHVALQSKVPWVSAIEAIAGHEAIWRSANKEDFAVLPFNHKDKDNEALPPPTQTKPPTSSPAFDSGMQNAFNWMMMVSGQWQNQMGMMGNERTGSAIQERQEQGDVATFHFTAHFEQALAQSTRVLVEVLPRFYDTRRVLRVMQENEEEVEITVDPAAREAYAERMNQDNEIILRVLNPAQGRYDVQPGTGVAFASRREQTVRTMTMLLTQAPGLTAIIGDLLLDAMEFKEAREAAARMRRMVPKQAMGQGPSQQEAMLAQQVQSLQGALAKAMQQVASLTLKNEGKTQMRDIDVYKAETDRIKALGDLLGLDQGTTESIIQQLGRDTGSTSLLPVLQANQDDLVAQGASEAGPGPEGQGDLFGPRGPGGAGAGPVAPHPGARRGEDGEWYLADPTRRGRYLRLEPLATIRNPPS